MKALKRIVCILIAVLLIVPFGVLPKDIFAKDGMIKIYTSEDDAQPGDYYLDTDGIYESLYDSRYAMYILYYHATESEAKAYAEERAPKDYEDFLNADWYVDPEGPRICVDFPEGATLTEYLNINEQYTYLEMVGRLHVKDIESLEWLPVTIPASEDALSELGHGDYYLDLGEIYKERYLEVYNFYTAHPEYMEGWEEGHLEEICNEYAADYVKNMSNGELYVRPDDPFFRVRRETVDTSGERVTAYFPHDSYTSMMDDISPYIKGYHDYSNITNWDWRFDPETLSAEVYVTVKCYLGELDGTNDEIVEKVENVASEIIEEPTETKDGTIKFTATYILPGNGLPYTQTKTFRIPAKGDVQRLEIVRQPEDATVQYPDGASFTVEVNDPSFVSSYQWIMGDGTKEYTLDGLTADDSTLVVPSTGMFNEYFYYYCIITDKNGNEVVSDTAYLYIPNYQERKPVLYVNDYALEPGDTLDLSTTPVGSGIVTFEDDHDMVFENIKVTASGRSMDRAYGAGGTGILLVGDSNFSDEYHMVFKGKCTVIDDYYDPEMDESGVALNADLISGDHEGYAGTLYIEGDGDLTLVGGTYALYSSGYLEICSDIKTMPYDEHMCRGMYAKIINVNEGVHVDIKSKGTAITAQETIYVRDGAVVDVDMTANHFFNQDTEGKGLFCMDLYCYKAELNISSHGRAEDFVLYDKSIAYMCAIEANGSVDFSGTKVNISMDADEGEYVYANNFVGISGTPLQGVVVENGADVKIEIDSPYILKSYGIYARGTDVYEIDDYGQMIPVHIPSGSIFVDKGSRLDIDVCTSGHVTGIEVTKDVGVNDGDLKVSARSYDTAIIIAVDTAEFNVNLTDSKYSVDLSAPEGSALIASDIERVKDTEFTEDYEPKLITINKEAKILVPEDGVVCCYGFDPWRKVTPVETVLSKADPENAATRILIAVPKPPAPPTGDNMSIWLMLMVACIGAAIVLIKKYRQTVRLYGK